MEDSQVKQPISHSERILKEKDPILREIYAIGYTHVEENNPECKLILYSETQYKELNSFDFRQFVYSLKIIRGYSSLELGSIPHAWVSEADGSAQRVRDYINPDFTCENKKQMSAILNRKFADRVKATSKASY